MIPCKAEIKNKAIAQKTVTSANVALGRAPVAGQDQIRRGAGVSRGGDL